MKLGKQKTRILLLTLGLIGPLSGVYSQDKLYSDFPLEQAKRFDGSSKHTQELDNYAGWHYLSDLATHETSTNNAECESRMEYMYSEPEPYQDKSYVGLCDAWSHDSDKKDELQPFETSEYGIDTAPSASDVRMEQMLGDEFGGMDDVYVQEGALSSRSVVNLNRDWKYIQGDFPGAEQPTYDDTGWATIGVPHSFSIPYFMSKDFYVGYGWYRKRITLTPEECSRRVFLEFDGVFQKAEVFVNGKLVGSHAGGYTGFPVDISSDVKPGENLIAVRVNNLWNPVIAPRGGEHVFSGGIYRNVRLVLKSPAHIDWYGIFVTTPDLAVNQGKKSAVEIRTDVCNDGVKDGKFRLVTCILDPDGIQVGEIETAFTLAPNTKQTVKQRIAEVKNPALWHPRHPSLYRLVSRLYEGKELLDSDETDFGFRWFEWTADRGFFLNGNHYYFRGANVHQDQAGWGDAVTDAALRRDVSLIKEAGFDMIRGSHYPHAPAFSKACDELGILLWSEATFWGTAGEKVDGFWTASAYPVVADDVEAFEENALKQLEEMIRIHRNHPSIMAWSMGNETFFSTDEAMPGVRRLLKRMVDLTHQLDPTRPAAVGGVQRPIGSERIDKIGDVAGYNGDGSMIADFQNPGVPNVVSEYGSTTADRPGEYTPGWGDLARDEGWKGRPWRCGQAIWCGFDHGSIFGEQMGKMGIIDYFRLPKRSWYWYRNEYAGVEPPEWPVQGVPDALRLTASRYTSVRADGTDDVQLVVSVIDAQGRELSNSPEVELRLVSGPGEFPTGSSITFRETDDIRILDGKAAIAFRSYYAGKAVVEAVSPGLKPARIEIVFEGGPQYEAGKTPAVQERPYTPYVRKEGVQAKMVFGRNNPTFASSEAEGCSAGYAADGDLVTCWKPVSSDTQPYWMLDTERSLYPEHVRICFGESPACPYVVEISADKQKWTVLEERAADAVPMREVLVDADQTVRMRFVRIRFLHVAETVPSLAEVEVTGTLAY